MESKEKVKTEKQKKRERYENLAKKSILFKPLVFRKLYRFSKNVRKDSINKYIEQFTCDNNLTKKE